MSTNFPSDLIDALPRARAVAVLTGAGISAESGIPTFRDALTGLWAKYDPVQLATPDGFAHDPALVSRWYDQRRCACAQCRPNAGHLALARLEAILASTGRPFLLATQNVDGLHHLAGSHRIVELHGSLWCWRCTRCGREQEERGGPFAAYPPRCPCGGLRRPAVIWFGEDLPQEPLAQAQEAAAHCDLFLALGTSAIVHPAAGLIDIARHGLARILEVNTQPTPATAQATWSLRGRCGEVLGPLITAAFGQ